MNGEATRVGLPWKLQVQITERPEGPNGSVAAEKTGNDKKATPHASVRASVVAEKRVMTVEQRDAGK